MKNPRPDIDAHMSGTKRGEERAWKGRERSGQGGPRPHRPRCHQHQSQEPGPNRSAYATPATGVTSAQMDTFIGNAGRTPLATLQQFVSKPRERVEVCELCSAALFHEHQHLLELAKRQVVCACEACAILFGGHAAQRYRRIPRDVRAFRDFAMDDQEWESLLIPINMAFFFYSSAAERVVANYPSPGGAMESYWTSNIGLRLPNAIPF